MRTLTGHLSALNRVEFSHDGAQVIGAGHDDTVLVWDVASGRQICQLAGDTFALVEGLSDEHIRDRHVLTTHGATLLIYKIGNEEQYAGDGVAAAPVACFKAPQVIYSVRCFGATICVGCCAEGQAEGAVCLLSAPVLAASTRRSEGDGVSAQPYSHM